MDSRYLQSLFLDILDIYMWGHGDTTLIITVIERAHIECRDLMIANTIHFCLTYTNSTAMIT